ncbi:MAG: aspartate aminotransferase family protein [Bryobacterales bacterium]|nr:aspartate aminotransferase family protein [Bryobacterales bacterium]
MELEKQYVLQNYGRYPLAIRRGKGTWLYDFNGKRYLDLISGIGVNALGHAHPRLTRVIREQAGLLIHCSNLYFHEYQGKLAEKLAKHSGLQRSFFCNSGTEAMEGAMKMIRSHGNGVSSTKQEIVALDNSFHGRSLGALSITGQPKYRKDFEPLLAGPRWIPANDTAALNASVNGNTAAIVLEGIQGEGGIYPMDPEFLRRARVLADEHNALLVFDATQCGVGRTGTWFSHQLIAPDVNPDVMVTAKPLACGLPLGVVMCNERAAASIRPGMHGSTFGGGALACRAALEFIDIMENGLLEQVSRVGEYFREGLRGLKAKHSFVKEVRGAGLMIGVELDRPGKNYVMRGIEEGLLFNATHDTVLRFLPPYILTEKEVDRALRTLDKLFRVVKV